MNKVSGVRDREYGEWVCGVRDGEYGECVCGVRVVNKVSVCVV